MGPHNLNNTFHSEIVNQIPFTVAACPKKNLMSILVEPWYLHTVTFLFKDKSICFQYKQRVPLGGRLGSEGNNTAVESRSWMEFFQRGKRKQDLLTAQHRSPLRNLSGMLKSRSISPMSSQLSNGSCAL